MKKLSLLVLSLLCAQQAFSWGYYSPYYGGYGYGYPYYGYGYYDRGGAIASGVGAGLLGIGLAASSGRDRSPESTKIKALENQIDDIQNKIKNIEKDITKANKNISRSERRGEETSHFKKEIERKQNRITEHNKALEKIREDLADV